MSNTLEAKLKLDIAELIANQAKAQQETKKWIDELRSEGKRGAQAVDNISAATRRATGFVKAGQAAGRIQLGGVAMQAQDIAVQLQMGTAASIVLAQQGSQILSAFGAGGAIAGGVLAIGGAFFTMAQKSRENFDAMKADADGFADRMKASLTGSSSEIATFFGEVRSGVSSAYSELESLQSGWSGIGARMAALFGGPSVADRERQANDLAIQKANALATIQTTLLARSADEVKIAELKAAGNAKAAEAMQRQLDLSREIQRIQGTQLDPQAKQKLTADAKERTRLEGITPADPAQAAKAAEQLRALKREAADAAQGMLPDDQRLAALRSKLEGLMMNSRMRNLGTPVTNVEQMGALAARSKSAAPVQEYKQALEIQKEIIALEQQLANKKEADDQHARRVKDARAVLDIEMKIAREQARGGKDDSATINKFRDELNVIQLTAQVQDQLKVSQAEALKIAVQKVSAERAAADAIKAQAEAERKKSQLYNRQELAAQLRAEALRAAGRDKEAAALERRIRVVNEAKRIESATGLDPARAMQIAERREKTRARDDFRQGMTGSSSLYNADGSKTGRRINARIEGGWEDSRERARQRLLQNETRRREALASRGPAGMNEFWALQRGEVGQLPGASRLGEAAFGVRQAQNDSRTAPAPTVALSAREMEVLIAIKDAILKLAP